MIIIKFGGSVIQDTLGTINPLFPAFISFISQSQNKLFLVNGGGIFCRFLQDNLRSLGVSDSNILDEMGIYVNNMFSFFIKSSLPTNLTFPELIKDLNDVRKALNDIDKYRFFIGGSKGVGHSSDYDAVVLGNAFGSKYILKISNIKYVYDKDPKLYQNAKQFDKLSWNEYLNLVGSKFYPGASFPFDPIASKKAKKLGFAVRLTTLDDVLEKKTLNINDYNGTLIG